jgi:beta-N-acetylhexosaminidase
MSLNRRLTVLTFFLAISLFSQASVSELNGHKGDPPFLKYMNHPWVDSVLKTLSPDERIAQCIWIAGWSNKDIAHEVEVSDLIRKHGIGGIIFFQGTGQKQVELTNYYQKISKVPLLIAMDAEWGSGMRLSNVEKFPFQMTLGAITDDSLIYHFGSAVSDQFRRLGMHINLAPVADINNNSRNPVINYRSFGENRENVASKTTMYMKGLQDNGITAVAKHFPGHGDTDVDSHYDLPLILHLRSRLDSLELYPFRELISEGIGSIMTAHLNLPSLDTTSGLPSTLSSVIITDLLKKELGFEGLIITDAMNMKGVTKYFKPGEADARALAAGNDVIEYVTDVEAAIKETRNYIQAKKLTNEDITLKCRKILALKYWSGLDSVKQAGTGNIDKELTPVSHRALIRDLYANALTVLLNKQDVIPVKNLDKLKIATLAINRNRVTSYQKRISKYYPADHYSIDPADIEATNTLIKKLAGYDLVIAGVFGLDQRPNQEFGIKPALNGFIRELTLNNKTIVTWFGNPYGIEKLPALQGADGLVLTYQENEYAEDLSAQLIFGGIGARGKLPVSINQTWPSGFGILTDGNLRVQYGLPENAGLSSEILERKIDSIVNIGLTAGAFPGCEVMIARKGIIVYHETYGYQTYDNRVLVREDDLFDLASVTKISAALPGLMLLHTEGRFSPEDPLDKYLPYFRRSDKGDLLLKDILTHQAGMTPFIPFWQETMKKNGKFKRNIFDHEYAKKYPLEVAHGLYINKNFRRKMFAEMRKSPLGEKKYVYSDLTFIITPEIIEKVTDQVWNEYVKENIYDKIGAFDISFNPYLKYPLSRIVPTEYDSLFRKQQLQGTVHDETAAMLGGISGHAGLFATANDLMKLMELYRRMGEYGGEQIIGQDVLRKYTSFFTFFWRQKKSNKEKPPEPSNNRCITLALNFFAS